MKPGNTPPPLVIDFVSDPICPWCYIGFRALSWAAMALSFEHDLTIRFRPYRLDPDTPPEGKDRASTLARKIPDPAIREQMRSALKTSMKDVGMDFPLDVATRIPDTTDAHRLIRWAHDDGVEKDVMAGLFEAYWQHGEDIGKADVLAAIAEGAGMDGKEVAARLATAEDKAAVKEEAADYRAGGICGVPTFIVNEQAGFAGALPKADLVAALRQLASETSFPPADD